MRKPQIKIRNDSEEVFIFDAVRNRSIHSSKNMYPYIILKYPSQPKHLVSQDSSFEIGMFFDKIKELKIHTPTLRIVCSDNAVLTTDNGERDKEMTPLTRKTLRANRIVRFKIKVRIPGTVYIGFFGEGVKYIDYLALLEHMSIQSKYIRECERLQNLIVSPISTIENFDMNDIPDAIQFLKLDGDMYQAKDGDITKLICKKDLKSLYLVGAGYVGDVQQLIHMSNIKNAVIIAPNATGYQELKKENYPDTILLDSNEYYVAVMR